MEITPSVVHNARRRVLYSVICATCHELGFGTADKLALETLLQMIHAFIYELARSARAFTELSGRTEPLVGDVVMALIEMGVNIDSLANYALRPNRVIISCPQQMAKQNTPRILQAGDKKPLSNYIPEYFPPFPDPHSYIRTPTHKQPVTEYEAIREKSATQKRDVERALTRFMAKTCNTSLSHSLFPDEQMCHLFPLIALKVYPNSYLNALLPKDQIFDDDDEEQPTPKKEPEKKPKSIVAEISDKTSTPVTEDANVVDTKLDTQTPSTSSVATPIASTNNDSDVFDNPYLRPVKSCRNKKSKKQLNFDN